jgi:hypothetical protein
MDFGKPFVYMFEDKEWPKKLLVFSLISLIPILGQIVLAGWTVEIIRNLVKNNDETLPDLKFENQLVDGFKYLAINFIYMLPIFLLTFFPGIMIFIITIIIGSEDAIAIGISIFFFLFGIFFILALPFGFIFPAIATNFAVAGKFAAGFEIKKIFGMIKNHILSYLVVLLGVYCASYISQLGINLLFIGVIPASVYAQTIIAHFYGQVYKISASE